MLDESLKGKLVNEIERVKEYLDRLQWLAAIDISEPMQEPLSIEEPPQASNEKPSLVHPVKIISLLRCLRNGRIGTAGEITKQLRINGVDAHGAGVSAMLRARRNLFQRLSDNRWALTKQGERAATQ